MHGQENIKSNISLCVYASV